jgi:hypothetical protein
MRPTSFAFLRFGLGLALLVAAPVLLTAAAPLRPDAVTPDGGRYYGPLVDAKLHGQGRLEWENEAHYEGGFERGLFSGSGRYESGSGYRYEGGFVRGLRSGRGRMQNGDGTVYVGEFSNGRQSGEGELTFSDGRKYRGAFVQGQFHGKGRYELPGGEVFEGEFERNQLTGAGTHTRGDGSRHEGRFVRFRAEGPGKFTDAHGNVYEGTFVAGELNGAGRVTAKDGTRYEGELQRWSFHGQGELRFASGDVYRGAFAHGQQEGKGTLTFAKPRPDGRTQDSGTWRFGKLEDPDADRRIRLNVEAALYRQRSLLDQAVAALQARDPKRINLYLLAVAGDGSQEVFRREVEFVRQQLDRDFGTRGRSLALVNSRTTVESAPMATVTSIREALRAIAARMDRDQDILFLFLTSHGSKDHELVLDQNGMDLRGLPAKELGALLAETGIRWKVVLVSACYSGGFIEHVKDERTMVITAARHDRQSFGCADDNDFTYFGRAFFKESLAPGTPFPDAFRRAEKLVREWEAKELGPDRAARADGYSLPQIHNPTAIRTHLNRWREQLAAARGPVASGR